MRRAKSRAVDASQPYNYLVDRIADVERDADASARREREMGEKLEAARAAAHAAREEATALRKDLKAALDERSELAFPMAESPYGNAGHEHDESGGAHIGGHAARARAA